jgi:deoxyribonuclease-4
MSISGGLPEAIARARSVDATALQVFVKSSNQWAARAFSPGETDAYRAASQDAGLDRHTLAHASYLINLASPDEALWTKSVEAFRIELERCDALGIPWLVVHPGAHVGSGVTAGISRVAAALDRTLTGSSRGTGVLLENTAGQGSTLGARFEELGLILQAAKRGDRLGVCLDTCHAFASGYDLRTPAAYAQTMAALDHAVGLAKLHGIHLNDSKGDLGSRKDRHEHIGRGKLGLEAFRLLLADRRFLDVPMVLETEKGDDLAEDCVNLGVLRGLVAR